MTRLSTLQLMASHLDQMCTNTQVGLSTNRHWWVFGPFFCRKFLTQAKSIELLLNQPDPTFDVSSIWTLVRSLYEIHATYYHLFIPCNDIEENILRFRLWELDSTKSLLKFRRQHIQEEVSDKIIWLTENEQGCQDAIKSLSIFNALPEKTKKSLLERPNWRMILPNATQKVSYDNLIKNTKIKDTHFQDMYDFTSMHVHPAYGGIRQNLGLEAEEIEAMKYTAVMQTCFVTSFFIMDLRKRYTQAKDYYNTISAEHQNIIDSFESKSRDR